MKRLFVALFIIMFSGILNAQDFGVLADQNIDITSHGNDFSGVLIPRLSLLMGEESEMSISAGLNYRLDALSFVPELLRAELILRFGMGDLKLGRMAYQDPSGIVASGLFDGLRFSYDTIGGTYSVGCWYTGLLNRKRASIAMSDNEQRTYNAETDYADFANTYFAPRRILSALDWEHPALGDLINLRIAFLGQFDLSGADLHSLYNVVKIAIPFRYVIIDMGGCFESIEYEKEFSAAMAADLKLTLLLPARINQLISLQGRFSSGVIEGNSIGAYLPLTMLPQGNLLKANFSGLSMASLHYIARLRHTLSADLSAAYFIRSDLGTYLNYPVTGAGGDGYFLGPELFGRLMWSITSGIQINAGGGVFLPALGDAAPQADMLWRAECNVVVSIY